MYQKKNLEIPLLFIFLTLYVYFVPFPPDYYAGTFSLLECDKAEEKLKLKMT